MVRFKSIQTPVLIIEGDTGYGMFSEVGSIVSYSTIEFGGMGLYVNGRLVWTHRDDESRVRLVLGLTAIDKFYYILGKDKKYYDLEFVLKSGKFGYTILDKENLIIGEIGSCQLNNFEENSMLFSGYKALTVIGGNDKLLLIYCFTDKRLYLEDYTYGDGAVSFSVDGSNQIVVPRVVVSGK